MMRGVETLNPVVDRELRVLAPDLRARFARICQLIEMVGLERMGMPHVRHLTGLLWEMRLTGRDGIARSAVVVVRVFVKKTRRAPRREIELALRRAEEMGK